MDPLFARVVVTAGLVAIVAVRVPHAHRSARVPVARRRRGALDVVLLALAQIAFFVPLVWAATPALACADLPLRPVPFAAGTAGIAAGVWFVHRAHADLGTNWSATLQVREGHRLVTRGVYRRVRHPMYAALLLHAAGQALALPNLAAGLPYLVAMALLVATRLGPEERLMREEFGAEYDAYARASKRLVPGLW